MFKYSLYYKIFNFKFNICFGFSVSDKWDTCEKQQVAIKAAETEDDLVYLIEKKTVNKLHLLKANAFNLQLKEATESARLIMADCDTAATAMDFQKIGFPVTGDS